MVTATTIREHGVPAPQPAEVHRQPAVRDIDVNGVRLSFRDHGGSGRPVVLLHGLASSAHIWDVVGSHLTYDHRVVALDQRGHGSSDRPDSGYDFETVTRDLAAFVEALGLDCPIIVGHSWGAHVALEYAARGHDASGVVLVDGGHEGLEGKTWEEIEREMAPPDLTHLTPGELLAQVKEWEWGEFWSPAVEAEVLSLFDVTESGTVRPKLTRENHFQILRAVWEQRLDDVYRDVQVPVQLVPALPRTAPQAETEKKRRTVAAAAEALDAGVRWFEQTYHDIPLQRPHALASIIREFNRGQR